MTLGEKILAARREAGLSQRQLCGEIITRNMLSQIEHGTARPSMDTLRCLAAKLQKPVSFFLDEEALVSPNQSIMLQARRAFDAGDLAQTRALLETFREPDAIFSWEYRFLKLETGLALGEQALGQGKEGYALALLEELEPLTAFFPGSERRRLLLLGRLPHQNPAALARQLPGIDEELLLLARGALAEAAPDRAETLLSAAENRETPEWNLLMGRAKMARKAWAEASECLQKAEHARAAEVPPLLEICFRELGDYRRAYEYACLGKQILEKKR